MTARRDNGLEAEEFTMLALMPSELADILLESLREVGIAGYAAPVPADSTTPAPGGLRLGDGDVEAGESVYVDTEKRGKAEDVLHSTFSGSDPRLSRRQKRTTVTNEEATTSAEEAPPESSEEEEHAKLRSGSTGGDPIFDDLVARFYQSKSANDRMWPDAENVSGESAESPSPDRTEADDADPLPAHDADITPERRDASGEGHYVPPTPPPLPRGDAVSRLSWAGVLGGPAVWVLLTILGQRIPDLLALLFLAGFIGGFIALVLRMGDHRPKGPDPDSGTAV